MKQICLIRHGKTQGNLERRYIGSTDEPLCAEGRMQLQARTDSLLYPPCQYLFASPMKRCVQTASLIYPDKEPCLIPDLRECDFGDFEGKTYSELSHDPRYQAFLDSNGAGEIPHGESAAVFKQRCLRGFREVLRLLAGREWKAASVICHGGTIMAILEAFDAEHRSFYDYQLKNGDGYLCIYDEASGLLRSCTHLQLHSEKE